MKKQIKETSFWKPEKISSTRVIRGNPLFDFPGSKQSNPRKQSNNKSNMFMTGFIPKTKYISPIYTKPTYTQPKRVPIPSHMGINPKPVQPVHPINTNTNVPKKNMNWFQAKTKFPKLNPFGDADHDGVINMLDCKPFDKLMQDAKSRAYFKKFNKKVAKPIDEKSIKAINKIIKSQDLEGLYLAGKQAADVAKLKNNTVKNSSIEKIKLFSPEITIRKSSIKRQDIPESKLVTTPLTPEEQADYFEQIVRGMEPYMNQDKVYDVPEVIEKNKKQNNEYFEKPQSLKSGSDTYLDLTTTKDGQIMEPQEKKSKPKKDNQTSYDAIEANRTRELQDTIKIKTELENIKEELEKIRKEKVRPIKNIIKYPHPKLSELTPRQSKLEAEKLKRQQIITERVTAREREDTARVNARAQARLARAMADMKSKRPYAERWLSPEEEIYQSERDLARTHTMLENDERKRLGKDITEKPSEKEETIEEDNDEAWEFE